MPTQPSFPTDFRAIKSLEGKYKGKTTRPVDQSKLRVKVRPTARKQQEVKTVPMPSASGMLRTIGGIAANAPGALADLAVSVPKAAYDYARTTSPSGVLSDVKSAASDFANFVRENPGEAFVETVAGTPKAAGEMLREATLARDAGDEERAAQIEKLAVPMLLGSLIPATRAAKGAGKVAKAEERAARKKETSLAAKGEETAIAKPTGSKPAATAPSKPKTEKPLAAKPTGEKPKGQKVAAVPAAPETKKPLMGLHNINERKLGMANRLGGLPVPSIAVANPELGFENFGNISLVAPQKLVTPSAGNPVFGADVYSARFPALSDDETKIFRGYTDNGRKYSPLTLANVVREMRGNPRNAEGSNYGAGSVRAVVAPEFKSVREMQNAREQIIPSKEFQSLKDEANDRLYSLGERFLPFSKYSRPSVLDFPEQLAEAARVGFHDLDYNYENLPPELLREAQSYLDYLRDMPTEYFEAKPQRGVSLGEFAGAVVPKDTSDEVIQILQNQGLSDIQRYDPDRLLGLPTRKEALERFRIHRFKHGGLAVRKDASHH